MSASGLGFLLHRLRTNRGLSLREVSELAKLDHAYVYRLEAGEKSAPSEEALKKLTRALRPGAREVELLKYLASHPNAHPMLIEAALSHPEFTLQAFAAADGASFRGMPLEPTEMLRRMQALLDASPPDG